MIPLYKPYFTDDCFEHVQKALDSKWIIWRGEYKDIVKNVLEKYLDIEHLLLLSNGTVACHLISKAVRLKYPNIKKIIVPNNVYIAAWNGFLFDGYFKLIPIDADIDTWNFDISKIDDYIDEQTAVLVVHNLGNIVNVPKLQRKFPETIFVEDNCEGFSGEYENKKSGTQSFCSAISFCGNKIITSGEGGALLVHNQDLYEYMFSLHCQGESSKQYIHDKMGYNYRMTNIQAAILYGQFEMLDEIKRKKTELFDFYRKALSNKSRIVFQKNENNTINAEWMMAIRVLGNVGYDYTKNYFNTRGVDIRPMFYPINYHPYLSNIKCETKNAEILSRECFMIPSFPSITDSERCRVADVILSYIGN